MKRKILTNLKDKVKGIDTQSEPSKYEDNYTIEKLKMVVVIVSRHQGKFFVDHFIAKGASSAFVSFGNGTLPSDVAYMLGMPETRKDVVITIVKESLVPTLNSVIEERFKVSKASKGISFVIDMDAISGVIPYKFFTNTKEDRRKEDGK